MTIQFNNQSDIVTPSSGQLNNSATVVDKALVLQGGNNLVIYSQLFSDASWTKSNVTVSGTLYTAPDGTTTASKLIKNNTITGSAYLTKTANTSGSNGTLSIYAKAAEDTQITLYANTAGGDKQAVFNLSSGVVVSNTGISASIQSVGNGWYLCSFTTLPNNQILIGFIGTNEGTGNGTSGIYIWGVQLEPGSVASAYTPTTTTAITTTNNISVPSGSVTSNSYSINGGTGFYGSSTGAEVGSAGSYSFSSTTASSGTADTYLYRDAANTLAQRNSTNAQTFRLYNTYTDASNYERLSIDWSTTANTATIVTQNAGTGSARNLAIGQDLYVNSVRVGLGGGAVASNLAIGNGAINSGSATGTQNLAIGTNALRALSSGINNVGIGSASLYSNTIGSYNIAIGYYSLLYNLSGNYSTSIGVYALNYNTNGSNLTAIGWGALASNTSNVSSLGSITSGGTGYNGGASGGPFTVTLSTTSGATFLTYPTASITVTSGVITSCTLVSSGVGASVLTATVLTATSAAMVAAGFAAGGSGLSIAPTFAVGNSSTSIGYQSGYLATTASNGCYLGATTGYYITTGSNNTLIGAGSGASGVNLTTGSLCVYVGYNSHGSASANNNEIVIGASSVGLGSNTTVLGNTSTTLTQVYGITKATNYTVATLPSASTSGVGARAFVTDALAPVFGATVVTGGAVATPVYSDSTNWKVG